MELTVKYYSICYQ